MYGVYKSIFSQIGSQILIFLSMTTICRLRGRGGKCVVFATTLIAWTEFNPHYGYVAASLDTKRLYDDYVFLVALN